VKNIFQLVKIKKYTIQFKRRHAILYAAVGLRNRALSLSLLPEPRRYTLPAQFDTMHATQFSRTGYTTAPRPLQLPRRDTEQTMDMEQATLPAAAAAGVTATVDLSPASTDLGGVHLLPCGIRQNGAVAVSDYFKPRGTGTRVS
jgi:hypothetical protein